MIAEDLIEKQKASGNSKDTLRAFSESLKEHASGGALSRTIARLHQNVTILFTDIVGFTEMSQRCKPYEVMYFLHNLYVQFDELMELDAQLWKVETIGDSFMVGWQANTYTITITKCCTKSITIAKLCKFSLSHSLSLSLSLSFLYILIYTHCRWRRV